MDFLDVRAFTLGMLALLNPCGFALLPAYLGFFLGTDADDEASANLGRFASTIRALNRSQVVGLSMSAGFLAVFGILGLLLAGTLSALARSGALFIITIIIGIGIAIMGLVMLTGRDILVKIPKLNKGGGSRSIGSMFLFGVSYAVASLSCTTALFFSAVGTSSGGASFGERFGSFISYGLGMGLLATGLTLAVGFGRKGIVNGFRSVLPKMTLISAVILIVVGVYVALYGIWSRQVVTLGIQPTSWIDAIVVTVEGWQASLNQWLGAETTIFGLLGEAATRTSVLGVLFLAVNLALAVAGAVVVLRSRRSGGNGPTDGTLDDACDTSTTPQYVS